MDTQIIATYCLCDDLLKRMDHRDDPQSQMTDAEVLTTAIVAALFFGGNFETARHTLQEQGYIPHRLSKSRFNRRVHRLQGWIMTLFNLLGLYWKAHNPTLRFVLDSCPVAAWHNYRIRRQGIPRRSVARLSSQQTALYLWAQAASQGHRNRAAGGILPRSQERE